MNSVDKKAEWQTGECETAGTYWVYSPAHRQVLLAQRCQGWKSEKDAWEWDWEWRDYNRFFEIPDEEGLAWIPCEVPEYKE